MYVIRRNNHYYKETVCDPFNYDRLPAPRHVYVTSQRNAKQFATIAEAYAVGDTVGGITVEKVPSSRPAAQALSRDELLHRQLLRLCTHVPVSVIVVKLHSQNDVISALLAGQFASVNDNVKERLSIALQDAPLDERFRDWEDTRFIFGREERQARFQQLRPLLKQCMTQYHYNRLDIADAFGIGYSPMRHLLSESTHLVSAFILYQLEQGLLDHGYELGPHLGPVMK